MMCTTVEEPPTPLPESAARLSNRDLLRHLALLAGRERVAAVELVVHLGEADRRGLHLAEGFGSLFVYCTEVLRLAEHAAYNAIEAARASRRFPVVLGLLARGALNLVTLRLLAPHLDPGNHERLLAEASGRSRRQVEAIVARLSPAPDLPSFVRKLPAPPSTAIARTDAAAPPPAPAPEAPAAARDRPRVLPLAPERYRVQFTVGRETSEKLRQAQDLLRREIPSGDPGAIFDRALTLLLEDIARRKLAATTRPGPARPTAARSRHVPAEIKRAVWLRDGGQCAFVGRSGRRCRERSFLEFHHVDPWALGGETTAANLSLRCHAHNVHEARLVFGG
jgi:hypothetical protein